MKDFAAMQDTSPMEIVKIFRKRREYARVLLEMSRKQQDLICSDSYSDLLELLVRKQQIVTATENLSTQYSELWSNWRTIRSLLSADQQRECDELINEAEADYLELVSCEQQGTDELKSRRDHLQTQLRTVTQGSIAHRAYHEDDTPTRRIDIGQ